MMGRPSVSSGTSRYQYHSPDGNNTLLKGPRKVFCFCLLSVVLPSVLISIPLLMRFVVYGTASYHLNPSDMRILDHKISTMWCQSERVTANTSFTVYVTDGEPELVKSPSPLTIDKTLLVPDDHKEYWGFYLLKGSTFKIYTCARSKGGTLLIVKGRNHLEHCAYIGEADSAGDSDLFSDSNSNEDSITRNSPPIIPTGSTEEMSMILAKIRKYIKSRPHGYGKLKKNLQDWMLLETQGELDNSNEENTTTTKAQENRTMTTAEIAHHKIRHEKTKAEHLLEKLLESAESNGTYASIIDPEHGTLRRKKRSEAEIRRDTESGENGAFEENSVELDLSPTVQNDTQTESTSKRSNTPKNIWELEHSHHTGVLNQSMGNDGSNSESESSFSSSEEALARCQGVIASFTLQPNNSCDIARGFDTPFYEDVVNVSGYYYFIFGSENEKVANYIRARFELEKYEYDLPAPLENCTNVKECNIEFGFASYEKLVIQVPQPPPNKVSEWDEFYIADSECGPRTTLYLLFVLTVPLLILMCAFQ